MFSSKTILHLGVGASTKTEGFEGAIANGAATRGVGGLFVVSLGVFSIGLDWKIIRPVLNNC